MDKAIDLQAYGNSNKFIQNIIGTCLELFSFLILAHNLVQGIEYWIDARWI